MEWWRIMEQRKPAKLLRSKFLPQDEILLALRAAREMSCAWHRGQADVSDDKVPNQAMVGRTVSSAEDGWAIPLLVPTPQTDNASPSTDAVLQSPRDVSGSPGSGPNSPGVALNSPRPFCLHQAPCVAPQGLQHSRSFWNMGSLDSAFNICSSLAAMQQSGGTADNGLCLLDLSMDDCGATEYVLTHGNVRVQSAQVLPSDAAEKLQNSASNATAVVQTLSSSITAETEDSAMQAASVAVSNQLQDGTHAQTNLLAAKPMQEANEVSKAAAALGGAAGKQLTHLAAAETLDVASLPEYLSAEQQELDPTHAEQSVDNVAQPVYMTDAPATDSTHVQTAALDGAQGQHIETPQLPVATPAAYSLHFYEAMKATLKGAHLVIGSLGAHNGQGRVPIRREVPHAEGNIDGQHSEGNGQTVPTAQEGDIQHEGVMEAEYADGYRARLLWECGTALACLLPGTVFKTGHICTNIRRPLAMTDVLAAAYKLLYVW